MIELLFTACLSHDPDICLQRSLVYVDVTPMACIAGAQPELAKWSVAHPGYRIADWRCQVVSPTEVEA